jgi:hypothetical protein
MGSVSWHFFNAGRFNAVEYSQRLHTQTLFHTMRIDELAEAPDATVPSARHTKLAFIQGSRYGSIQITPKSLASFRFRHGSRRGFRSIGQRENARSSKRLYNLFD